MGPPPIIDADYTVLDETPQGDGVPAPTALAVAEPVVPPPNRPSPARPADASFIAHLIAAAAHTPQTRPLRRASPEDALASYHGSVGRQPGQMPVMGQRTSLIV